MRYIHLMLIILFAFLLVSNASAITGEQWHLVNQSIGTEYSFGFAVFDNKLWTVAGNDIRPSEDAGSNKTWYSFDGNIWYIANSTPEFPSRFDGHLITFNNKLWIIGGYWFDTDFNYLVTTDVWYSEDGNIWYMANASSVSLRDTFGVVAYNNKLWILGGVDFSTFDVLRDVWSSDDGIIWTEATGDTGWGEGVLFLPVNFNNKMWIMGGYWSFIMRNIWSSIDGTTWSLENIRYFIPYDGISSSVYDAGTKVFVHVPSTGIWYSSDMVIWNNVNLTPQFDTVDYINFGSINTQITSSRMVEFNGKLYLNSLFGYKRTLDTQISTSLNSIWYTDNVTSPERQLPFCTGSLSTASIVIAASAGLVILISGLIIIIGFFLVGLISKSGGGS